MLPAEGLTIEAPSVVPGVLETRIWVARRELARVADETAQEMDAR
jgi:hypothetical protein